VNELSKQGGQKGSRKMLKEMVTDPQQKLAKLQVTLMDGRNITVLVLDSCGFGNTYSGLWSWQRALSRGEAPKQKHMMTQTILLGQSAAGY